MLPLLRVSCFPARLRAGLSLCPRRLSLVQDLGPALGDWELFLPREPATSERAIAESYQ